jgi:hypothetical protein
MMRTVNAMFDGEVPRPDVPLDLEPNTRVRITVEVLRPDELLDLEPNTTTRITIEAIESPVAKTLSLLDTAASLNLDCPSDWWERINH